MRGVWVEQVISGKKGAGLLRYAAMYGVTSRVLFTHVFGEGTQLPRRRIATYCPNIVAGGGC